MNWNHLHLIRGNNINVAYHYPTSNLIALNDQMCEAIDSLKAGMPIEEISNKYKVHGNSIQTLIQSLQKLSDNGKDHERQTTGTKRTIGRITLHISNDCNLRCRYCYADGGNYKQSRSIMTEGTAKTFIAFCLDNFDKIGQIAFFGGEPMLNVEIMRYICEQFKMYNMEGRISYIPQFGIITNGTILTPQILQFIQDHISCITVSIDGPQKVNDANRINKEGKGSYDKIERFIRTLRKETDVLVQYEATFTQSHIDAHYKYNDITNFMLNEFGIKGTVVDEYGLDRDNSLDYWKTLDYEDMANTHFANMPEGFWHVLNAIVQKQSAEICPVVKDIFAISVDGTLYPCHMLNGIEKSSLGTISGNHIFNTPALFESSRSMLHLKQNKKCENCWGQNICSGCAVKRFYDEKKNQFAEEPKAELCELTLLHFEQILLMIAAIRKNPVLWTMLITKVQERQEVSHNN